MITKELLTRLETLQIPSRRRSRHPYRGEKASQRKGSSLEFSEYREYLQGDDIRSVDWNVYARTEHLFLKLFFEEESRPVYFAVDASKSMNFGSPSKLAYALAVAASLAYVCLNHYDRPQLLLLQGSGFRKISFRAMSQFFQVLQHLQRIESEGETHLNAVLKKISLAGMKRGIVFLLSDFFSPDGFAGMKHLTAAGNEVHCLQILSDEEIDPDFRGDLKMIDSETLGNSEVSISPTVIKRYKTRLKTLQQQLQKTAHHSFASFSVIKTSRPLDDLLLRDFKQQGLLA
jgi:uncharacterized protein (DUF58 family)